MVCQYFLRSKNEKQTPLEVERVDEYDESMASGSTICVTVHLFFWMEGLPIPKKMAEANKKNGSGVMFFEGLSCIAVVGGLKEFATVLSIASFLITQLHKVMINVKDESWRLTRSELPCGFQLDHHDSPWGFIDLLFWCWLATFGLERTGIFFCCGR